MEVFTEKWVQEICKKYKSKADYNKPFLYHVATAKKYEEIRGQIEAWVAELPDCPRKEYLISEIRDPNHFLNFYNALAVGSVLRQLGYQLECEKTIKEKTPEAKEWTPDWYVKSKDKTPSFIVEVLTTNPPHASSLGELAEFQAMSTPEEEQIRSLLGKLEQINVGVWVKVKVEKNAELTCGRIEEIFQETKQWLNKRPQIGSLLSFDKVSFEIRRYDKNLEKVLLFESPHWNLVNIRSLQKKIKEKVCKYASLEIPLVIAVVDSGQYPNIEMFRKALFDGGVLKADGTINRVDGLFRQWIELEAVIQVTRPHGAWEMNVIYNPYIANQIPTDALPSHCVWL